MYSEGKYSIDSDIIDINIKDKKVRFEYQKKPSLKEYLAQAILVLFLPGLFMVLLGAVLSALINLYAIHLITGDLIKTLSYFWVSDGHITTYFLGFTMIYPVLVALALAFIDFFFKTKTISVIHKTIFLFSEKHNITPAITKREYVFVTAKKTIEEIKIPSPSLGFFWNSTGEHRKFLDKIIFYHEKHCNFPQKQKSVPFGFFNLGLVYHGRKKALLKLYFNKVPNTGNIRITIY
ncbi:hypothetical protein LCGC14_1976380 [marine sediment metagenome]|uniref:Uncharacterized protein n=1 Tax=marine sediment metagenome TaxID=412755 RepID=A0A0F9HNP0_9ZZZZ